MKPAPLEVQVDADEIRSARPANPPDLRGSYSGSATRMQVDGSDVGASTKAVVSVGNSSAEHLIVKTAAGESSTSLELGALRDGCARLAADPSGTQQGSVWFDGKRIYARYQLPKDADNKLRHVFRCEGPASH